VSLRLAPRQTTVRSGATVAGDFVLRQGAIVPEGAVITNQDEADALPMLIASSVEQTRSRNRVVFHGRGVVLSVVGQWLISIWR
jgi:hypothetical protein